MLIKSRQNLGCILLLIHGQNNYPNRQMVMEISDTYDLHNWNF